MRSWLFKCSNSSIIVFLFNRGRHFCGGHSLCWMFVAILRMNTLTNHKHKIQLHVRYFKIQLGLLCIYTYKFVHLCLDIGQYINRPICYANLPCHQQHTNLNLTQYFTSGNQHLTMLVFTVPCEMNLWLADVNGKVEFCQNPITIGKKLAYQERRQSWFCAVWGVQLFRRKLLQT